MYIAGSPLASNSGLPLASSICVATGVTVSCPPPSSLRTAVWPCVNVVSSTGPIHAP